MYNAQGKTAVPLGTFGGITTLASPEDLPEGGSPRAVDVDFTLGSVTSRPGLDSAFVYDGGSLTQPAGAGASSTPPNIPWVNPTAVTGTTGFASVALGVATLSKTWTPSTATDETGTNTPWTNPSNALTTGGSFATCSPSSGFSDVLLMSGNGPTIPVGAVVKGIEVTFQAAGTGYLLTTNLQGGAGLSPGTQAPSISNASPTTYTVGGPNYLWGYTSPLVPFDIANMSVQIQAHRYVGSATISVNSYSIKVYYTYTTDLSSDELLVTDFGFDYPGTSQVVSLSVALNGFSTSADNVITGQLLYQGQLIGEPQTITLPVTTPATVRFQPDLWFVELTPMIVNDISFGVALSATSAGSVSLNDVQITANTASQSVNFNYVKTGLFQLGAEDNAGDVQTLALDSDGNLWVDPNFTGQLKQLEANIPANSFAKSVSQDDREYICFSDLLTGTYPPLQYVPSTITGLSYLDRVSQVGPGAAPLFASSLGGSSAIASITSWSITSNVVTFQASNTFTAGEVVQINALTSGSFMNGASFPILASGLTGSAFAVSLVHANASATESGTATPQYNFAITSITQPAKQVISPSPNTFDCILWSAGPGSTSAGNVLTFYYKDAQQNPTGDTSLINAYNNGQNPYVYISGAQIGNGTYQVTGVGVAKAPGGQNNQYYFTVQANSSSYQKIGVSSRVPGNYQQTVATMTTAVPVAGLTTGNQVLISNASPSQWDATYTITAVLNGSAMEITSTACSGGTATFDWSLTGTSTAAPAVGQYVDITNTLGGNGALNGPGQLIASVSGTTSGTFTVTGYAIPDFTTVSEQGQATTAGTEFNIDPGPAAVNTTTNPIYGNASTGQLTIVGGTSQVIGAGTRQGTVFFETRNGFETAPAPPVTFTTPANSNYIYASNLPIGPPNVIRRWVAFTEAGQNNVAGGSFYTIPTPTAFTVNGQTYMSSALVINDNTTTTAQFTFTDNVLLAATEIDVQGNDLFNEIELGNPAWNVAYAGRMFYGGCNAKIQNFNNQSFDGGYLANPGGSLLPLGWSVLADPTTGSPADITAFSITSNVATLFAPNSFAAGQQVYVSGLTTGTYFNGITFTVLATGLSSTQFQVAITHANVSLTSDGGTATPLNLGATLNVSPIFGNSYFIQNTTAVTQPVLGMIYQSAYQDAYGVNILQPNTLYSVRVTCRSNSQIGSLVVDLTDLNQGTGFGTTYANYVLPCNNMTSNFQTFTGQIGFTGNLANTGFTQTVPVPIGLQLRLFAANLVNQGDIEIDRIEIFPSQTPVEKTIVRASYINDLEAFDVVTGQLDLSITNAQSVSGAVELFDSLYFLKTASMFVTEDTPGSEPDQWDVKQVSNKVGAIGPNAFDSGEQWIVTACRQGLFLFVGHQPMKINQEIVQVWNAINWAAGNTIWVRNDVANRKIYVGVPLPTGPTSASALWLPDAPVNAAPTEPNVVLMLSYEGLDNADELSSGQQLRETMFGNLVAPDAKRKWSMWQITSPYADFITQANGNAPIMFGSGTNTSQILALDPEATTDAGAAINWRYCTFGFVDPKAANQLQGMGVLRKRWVYLTSNVRGGGNATITLYPNTLKAKYPYSVPGGVNLQEFPQDDIERPLNQVGTRMFVEYSAKGQVNAWMELSALTLIGGAEAMTPLRGISK